jgi:hypothetical protein
MTNTEPTQLVLLEDDNGKAKLTLRQTNRNGTVDEAVFSGYLGSIDQHIQTRDNTDGTKDGVIDLAITFLGLHRVEPEPEPEPEPQGPSVWTIGDRVRVQDERFPDYHGIPGKIKNVIERADNVFAYTVEFEYTTEDTAQTCCFLGSELKGEGS